MYTNNLNETKVDFTVLLSTIIIFLIMISGLNHSSGILSQIGFLSIGILMIMGFFVFLLNVLKTKFIFRKEKWLYIFSLLFIATYVISIFNDLKLDSLVMVLQISMVILFFWGVVFIPFNHFNHKLGYYFIMIIFFYLLLWWGLAGFDARFSGLMNNANTFGVFISMTIGIFIIFKKYHKAANKLLFRVFLTLGLLLVYASSSRAAWLMILIFLVVYILWPMLIKNKIIYQLSFIIFSIILFVVTVGYPKLIFTPFGYKLQELSRLYTGKNFFSGREILWFDILEKIEREPLVGYGASALPSSLLETNLSAHNYYLQMTLQVGIIGSTIFFLLLFSVWNYYYLARQDKSVRLIASIFMAILAYQLFEVTFTQNILAVALLQWFIIGIGVNITRRHYLVNKHENFKT
ncbi:O-antigen ligase family protein [Alkalibacillus silvisoli]|uniref:O-antigen ligase-related domain-containing protein n=1 Tax=Alkalibacillus silvisoli TaxID=392823 RepID=A0ABN1A720_9BACI